MRGDRRPRGARLRKGHATALLSWPLATIDRLVHLLDTPVEPWSVQLEVRVAATLDEDRLRHAVRPSLAQERWRAAARCGRWWRHPRWELSTIRDPLDVVNCEDDQDLAAARAELYARGTPAAPPPLRMVLARHPSGDVVMLNLDHAAGDGFTAVELVRLIARRYAGDGAERAAPEVPADAAQLPAAEAISGWRRLATLARELHQMVTPAARVACEGGSARPGYGFHHLALGADETSSLVEDRPAGATMNDVLLAALHLAVARWNQEHGRRAGRVSVHMPVNLRPGPSRERGAGNFSFPVAVATRRSERRSPAATLVAVTRRTRQAKAEGSARALLPLLRRLLRLPPALLRPLVAALAGPCVPSAVLTNLGRLQEPLWLEPVVTDVWMSPPVKMPSGLALGAVTVGGRLHLCVRYRHAQLGADAAARFAEGYLAALRSVAGLRHSAPAGSPVAA